MTIRSTSHSQLDIALRNLRNAFARLAGTEDRVRARRNGRARALTALRRARTALDEAYPNITVAQERPRLKTAKGRLDRLTRTGWKEIYVDQSRTMAQFAAAGVPVKHIKIKHGKDGKSPVTRSYYFIPAWAKAIGPDKPTALREAKRSPKLRAAALAAEALR
jgi:hypothetical protein